MAYTNIHTSIVMINRLVGDLNIFTSNFDNQPQFLKIIFFPDYSHMILRHTVFPTYVRLCLIKGYT